MDPIIRKIVLESVRIGLRYLGLYLVMKGVFDDETAGFFNDPAVSETIGGAIIAITEGFFVKAKIAEVKA